MQSTVAKNGQNILDIGLLKCGGLEAAFELALTNGLSLTDGLEVGQVLVLPNVTNSRVVDFFTINQIEPASNEVHGMIVPSEGIGYWAIGVDFIIQ